MGLSSMIYKNWDFSFSLRAGLGRYMLIMLLNVAVLICRLHGIYSGNAWHNVPQMSLAKNWKKVDALDALSDYFIKNASFLKCDNITLSYSFDKIVQAKNQRACLSHGPECVYDNQVQKVWILKSTVDMMAVSILVLWWEFSGLSLNF